MYFTIYKITNLINNKIYIGKHQTMDLNDDYMGSGKLIQRAISKYGIENFKKDVLFVFDSEDEMNKKESELVSENFCELETNYNLCPGGKGGWGYINSKGLNGSPEGRILGGINSSSQRDNKFPLKHDSKEKEIETKRLKSNTGLIDTSKAVLAATSKECIEKRNNTKTERGITIKGDKNPMFNKCWCVNIISGDRCVFDIFNIPDGWLKSSEYKMYIIKNNKEQKLNIQVETANCWYEKYIVSKSSSVQQFISQSNYKHSQQSFSRMINKFIINMPE